MSQEEQIKKILDQEAEIVINGVKLDYAQSMSVRVAVTSFRFDLAEPERRQALGQIGDLYDARLAEVERIMLRN